MVGQSPHKYPPYEDESQMRIKYWYWAESAHLMTGGQYLASGVF